MQMRQESVVMQGAVRHRVTQQHSSGYLNDSYLFSLSPVPFTCRRCKTNSISSSDGLCVTPQYFLSSYFVFNDHFLNVHKHDGGGRSFLHPGT